MISILLVPKSYRVKAKPGEEEKEIIEFIEKGIHKGINITIKKNQEELTDN
jgi:hypothetical protein